MKNSKRYILAAYRLAFCRAPFYHGTGSLDFRAMKVGEQSKMGETKIL